MKINILFVILIILLLAYGIQGFRRGMIEGLTIVLSYVVGIIVLACIAIALGGALEKNWVRIGIIVLILFVIRKLYKLFDFILDALGGIAKIPVVSWADKVFGIALGVIRGVLFIWVLFTICNYMTAHDINNWLVLQINENTYLQLIAKYNYVLKIMQRIV